MAVSKTAGCGNSHRYGLINEWLIACGKFKTKLLKVGCRSFIAIVVLPDSNVAKSAFRAATAAGKLSGDLLKPDKKKSTEKIEYEIISTHFFLT